MHHCDSIALADNRIAAAGLPASSRLPVAHLRVQLGVHGGFQCSRGSGVAADADAELAQQAVEGRFSPNPLLNTNLCISASKAQESKPTRESSKYGTDTHHQQKPCKVYLDYVDPEG